MFKSKLLTVLSVMVIGLLAPMSAGAAEDTAPDAMTGLKVGEKVPDFTLLDQNGKEQSLKGLLAKKGTTVLVFYRSALW
ncbi:MAG: hypothetical protein COA73_10935 [Candidatus Hydrogenedentota bacterium]|nr:MAG: hypothetical protein COA73_10935 [Candidatus Hydrogenedentota bacterium]